MKKIISQLKNSIIEILQEKDRLDDLPFLISQLSQESERLKLQEKVIVLTALPLDARLQNFLEKKLKEKLAKEVYFQYEVKPEIKGGLMLKIGDRLYDYSLRRRAEELERNLR